MAYILVVDDDRCVRQLLHEELRQQGHRVECLGDARHALEILGGGFDLVLLDNIMPGGMTGIEFLGALRERGLDVTVILMTGQGGTRTAIEAMNLGAFDYVTKPINPQHLLDALRDVVRKALAYQPGKQRVRLPGEAGPDDTQLLGNSPPMLKVGKCIGRVAHLDDPVLIQGPTGTGKSLVARAIHDYSPRKDKRFVPLYCPALNAELLEDELFGHELGYGPSADGKARKGLLEHADGGTLFLGAVADIPSGLQKKLLAVLKSSAVCRIGSNEPIPVNVRLISASNCDLKRAMREGRLLEGLYDHLSRVTIDLPTLKERGPEDLRLLADHFLNRAAERLGRPVPTLDESAWQALRSHSWPRNISELKNCMFSLVLEQSGLTVLPCDLPIKPEPLSVTTAGTPSESGARAALREAIRWAWEARPAKAYDVLHDLLRGELLDRAFAATGDNVREAARHLGVSEDAVRAWVEQLRKDASPNTPTKQEKKDLLLGKAITLIKAHPEWSAERLAHELGCSRATLYRHDIIGPLLKGRAGGRTPPRGYKDESGDMDAWDE